MKRLRWVLLVLCLVLFLLMGTTVLYARTLPSPGPARFESAGLNVCNTRLCLFQITPGITTWREAKRDLAEYITHDDGDHFHGQVGTAAIRVEVDDTGMQTSAIQVQGAIGLPDPFALHLRQIVEHFGVPCYVSAVDVGQNYIVLEYPFFSIQVFADENRLTLDSAVSSLTLRNVDQGDSSPGRCADGQNGIPWRGFASLREYDSLLQSGWWDNNR